MSNEFKNAMLDSRPPDFSGRGDRYLPDIAAGLQRVLVKAQKQCASENLRLDRDELGDLAAALVEFAEDTHADTGIWRSLESAQQRIFGTPLPLIVKPEETDPCLTPFDQRRVRFLLWTLLPCLRKGLLLSPTHRDLLLLSEATSSFLAERFSSVPQDSGVKRFLGADNRFGWDIKRKLIWLGTKSYLFRFIWEDRLDASDDESNLVAETDDFICQECTVWSGLGAIDILAGALALPEADRETLRSWYERHTPAFRVLATSGPETETITVRNVVNGETYTIRMDMPDCPFKPGMLVFGSLTPWRGEWYWSGEQRIYGMASEDIEEEIRQDIFQKTTVAYRYCPREAKRARELAAENHAKFLAHYGSELAVFPDGLSLAAAEQKRMQEGWSKAAPKVVQKVMQAAGLDRPRTNMTYPPEILNHEDGIGAFSHPGEGVEYLLSFNQVVSGMRKRGKDLTVAEAASIHGAITSSSICPAFVHYLVAKHGVESIATAFYLREQPCAMALDVLLHRYKGSHYRRRYPSITLVGVPGKSNP